MPTVTPQRPRLPKSSPAGRAAFAIVIVGTFLGGIAAYLQSEHNTRAAAASFDVLAQRVASRVATRFAIFEYGARGARSAVIAAGFESLDSNHFHLLMQSRDIAREFPGAGGYGLIRRLAPPQVDAFMTAVRRDGSPHFDIRPNSTNSDERFVIQYIEPLAGNRPAIGFDVASEPLRRAAAQYSMRTGLATATAPVTLVQDTEHIDQGILLMLPIYRTGFTPPSEAERSAQCFGWIFAPLLIPKVMGTFDLESGTFELALRDAEARNPAPLFATPGSNAAPAGGLVRKITISVYGRSWTTEVHATPQFLASLNEAAPAQTASRVSMLAAAIAAALYFYLQSRARATATNEEQARRAAIVATSTDAIIAMTLEGIITDWNAGATELFGFTPEEAMGRSVESLLVPPERAEEDHKIRSTAGRGERMKTFETQRRRRNGDLVPVSCTALPIIGTGGRVIGISKTLRDISAVKQWEEVMLSLNASLEEQVAARTESLDAARRDLQNVLDSVPSVIGYCDKNLQNRFINRAAAHWFGRDPAAVSGMHMKDLLGVNFDRSLPHMQAALRGDTQILERSISCADGIVRHSLTHYLPDVVDGEVRGFYAVMHDITQQTEDKAKLASALRENEALMSTIRRHMIFSVADVKGSIVEINDNFSKISGYSRAELVGRNHRIINSSVHSNEFWVEMWRTIASGQAWRGQICNRAKDGSLYWVDSIIAPFRDAAGVIEKYISIRIDITAAKIAEHKLRASEAFSERAGAIAGVGAWELDLRSRAVVWSAQTRKIHEVDSDYVPDIVEALNFYPPEVRPILQAAMEHCVDADVGWDLELPMVTAAGREIWVRAVGAADAEAGEIVRLVGAIQDITERKCAEVALVRERHLMSSLMDSLPDEIYFKDREGRYLRVNPALARRFGLQDPQEAIGKTDADFFGETYANRMASNDRNVWQTGAPMLNVEERLQWHDQPRAWRLATRMPLLGTDGTTIGTFGVLHDITARKDMEVALQRTNERFAVASVAAQIGFWEYNPQEQQLDWDSQMYALYGYTPDCDIGTLVLWNRGLHPEDRNNYYDALQAALLGIQDLRLEFRIVTPGGETRHLRTAAHVARDSEGIAQRITGVCTDITERKIAEIGLRETSSLLNTVLESASEVSVIATDLDLKITVFNAGAEKMLGYSKDELIGRTTPALIHDAGEMERRSMELTASLGRPIAGGAVFTEAATLRIPREWTYVRKDGGRLPVSLVITEMLTDTGEPFGYLGIATDVTRQKEQEAYLEAAIRKAEDANLAKSQFLANMSHEIRTPMNAVIGLSYLLAQTDLNPDQRAFLSKIDTASKSLLGLINDVLDLSKIESGEFSMEQRDFDLLQLLDGLQSVMSVTALAKGIALEFEVGPGVPRVLCGDSVRVNQILTNLLSNAIKFTERGRVVLDVRALEQDRQKAVLRFTIIDTGIGIPEDVQKLLFAPFTQADASITRRFGGTGLGLSIVKHLIERLGGDVRLKSIVGAGSEFMATIPFSLGDPESVPAYVANIAPRSRLDGVRILVVDDSEINLEVAKRILELAGASVLLARDGMEAVELLASEGKATDLVLMDAQMPNLDGYGATRRIRGELGLTDLPVVALTAGALSSERQRAQESGMNDFVTKPFDARQLIETIHRHVSGGTRKHAPAAVRLSMPAAHEAWPAIEGIDIADVQARLCNDLDLFRSGLMRMFREFADLAPPVPAPDTQCMGDLAQRVHKLKGNAGLIGARGLHHIAGACEDALRHCRWDKAGPLFQEMTLTLAALQDAAGSFLSVAAAPPSQAAVRTTAAPDAKVLGELLHLLQEQDLTALDRFEEVAAQNGDHPQIDCLDKLRTLIDNLQFPEAAEVLAASLSRAAIA